MKDIHDPAKVSKHIEGLDPSLAKVVQEIRKVILSSGKEIGEQIKWNSPSFFYTGEMKPFDPKEYKRDIVVINLHRGSPLLVFPTGAKIKDSTGLLEGDYKDGRRMIRFTDVADVKKKSEQLSAVVKLWLDTVEKP